MAVKEKLDVRDEIMNWLYQNDRSMRWLSIKTKIEYSSLYSILKQKVTKLSAARLEVINNFLGTKFKREWFK